MKDDQEHLIIKGNPYTISIREDVGYEECFKEENRNYILNSLHMKIYYKDDIVDDVKLTLFKGYSNDKLFFRNSQPIGLKEQEGIEVDRFQKEKLVSKIKKNFKQDKENEELSTYTVKEKNLEKKFYYIDMSPFLFLEVYNGKRSIEEYTLSLLTSELNYTDKRTSNSWRYCEGEFVCDSDNCEISKEKVEEFFSLYDEVLN